MITTLHQAYRIQKKRVIQGKPGIAKAVKRFLAKTTDDEYGYWAARRSMPQLPLGNKPKPVHTEANKQRIIRDRFFAALLNSDNTDCDDFNTDEMRAASIQTGESADLGGLWGLPDQ